MDTILLVEDNETNRELYRVLLEHFGFSVLEAADGAAALHMAREHLPDLILMDLGIPGIDGWDATRILKQDERTRSIPVVVLSAHAFDSDRERAEEAGCDLYLTKPAEPLAVVAEMERILGRRGDGV